MAFNNNTPVIGIEPRITRRKFVQILKENDSPAANQGGKGWDVVKQNGVDPLFALAVFAHESGFGKLGICAVHGTRNPGNTRTSRTGVGEIIETEKGKFVRYPSWVEGWRDLAFRLVDPKYVYVAEKRRTILSIIERWAPSNDVFGDNRPPEYAAAVIRNMTKWTNTGSERGKRER